MRLLKLNENKFFKKPVKKDKYMSKEILKYSIGTNLYMNGFKNFYKKIKDGSFKNLSSISICFEDSTREEDLKLCEKNVQSMLLELSKEEKEEIPLLFIRVRNLRQFQSFINEIRDSALKLIAGFIFPKFNSENGEEYFKILSKLNKEKNEIFYGMPIIEEKKVLYKETRIEELLKIKKIIDKNKELVLNIRVGGTDFSSKFGLRRSRENTIYDIGVVRDCLSDILNIFLRAEEDYVISAPVWEYFSNDVDSIEVRSFIKEIKMDKENGFIGKTIIHPMQIEIVNSLYVVTFEEYMDAIEIIEAKEGVFKGYGDNKMNEAKPHMNWAKRILKRSEAYGVLNKGISYTELL